MADSALQPDLQLYLRQINETALLTADLEKELGWRIINENDQEAKEWMIKANLRLVVSISKNYSHREQQLPRAVEVGTISPLLERRRRRVPHSRPVSRRVASVVASGSPARTSPQGRR